MTQWEYEQKIEKLNSLLLSHEIIVYNVPAGNKKMTEEDVVCSRGLIIQYVREIIEQCKTDKI